MLFTCIPVIIIKSKIFKYSDYKIVADAKVIIDELVEKYDLVITGEGRLDEQSLNGKVISGIMNYHPKKLEFVVGQSKLDNIEYPVHAIVPEVATVDEALSNPKECLKRLIKKSF